MTRIPTRQLIDPETGHLLTMNAHAGSVSEVDLGKADVVRTFALKPGLEFAVIGPHQMLYVNNEDANEIETVDLAAGKPGPTIALTGCEGPTGLAHDPAHDRLIAACANGVATVIDVAKRKVVQTIAIGRGPDAVLMDRSRQRALIPCGGSGTLELLDLSGSTIRKLGTVPTESGARTGTLDPATGRVYLPTARFGPPPAAGGRPQALPGSFHLLVLEPIKS